MANTRETMTTSGGNPIADNQNSISAGARGPLLMEDYQLLEKLAHQNRERIPERTRMRKKGVGGLRDVPDDHARHYEIFQGGGVQAGDEDGVFAAVFDGGRRARRSGRGAGRAGVRD